LEEGDKTVRGLFAVGAAVVAVAGCGESTTTTTQPTKTVVTVVKQAPAQDTSDASNATQPPKPKAASTPAPTPKTVSQPKSVPDVRGLGLPDAKRRLKSSGYRASVHSDALFGVVIEENFTVCSQGDKNGHLVPLEVSKECGR
jgi:uncharacterized lipoprotein YajG